MIYVLSCLVQIGKVQLTQVHSIRIKNSVKQLADEAVITLPRNLPDLNAKRTITDAIKISDPVRIALGYNGNNIEEFKGYITQIGFTEPLKITCQDRMYLLRQQAAKSGVYTHILLETFIHKVISGIKIATDLKITLSKFIVNKGASAYDVLFALKKDPYNLYSYFEGQTLHIGFAYAIHNGDKKAYNLRKNVKNNNLEYMQAEGRNFKIKAINHLPNGKKEILSAGNTDGVLRTLNLFNMPKKELAQRVEEERKHLKFSGYSGKITGFGFPRTRAGTELTITDEIYPERNGTYLTDAVTITFDANGYSRENELGYKL